MKASNIIAFILGGAVGAAVSYKISYKFAWMKAQKVCDEYYLRLVEENQKEKIPGNDISEKVSEESKESDVPMPPKENSEEKIHKAQKEYAAKNAMKRYNNVSLDEEDVDEELEEAIEEMFEEAPKPIMVEEEEWDQNPRGYELINLFYNDIDRTLYDEDEEQVEDIGGMVGWENLDKIDYGPNRYIWVRNDTLHVIYEICFDSATRRDQRHC